MRNEVGTGSPVVGDGSNFVRTMARLAAEGATPTVVADQVGRLTFTDEIVRAVRHLFDVRAPYGIYHVSNGGPPMSWADVARAVFVLRGRDPGAVRDTTTDEYAAGRALAPRPANSVLSTRRIEATGFEQVDARKALSAYASSLP